MYNRSVLAELTQILRPPGCGLYSPSGGVNPLALPLINTIFGSVDTNTVLHSWAEGLARLQSAQVVLLGVPSDTGAGSRRGAAFGPIGVRQALYRLMPSLAEEGIVDAGDIACVPHLLHDSMLSDAQITSVRTALYDSPASHLPVSPLSLAELACRELHRLAPNARIITIGGDHSVSGPCVAGLMRSARPGWGVLHFDAHVDLSTDRFGVALTYGSWIHYLAEATELHAIAQCGLQRVESPDWIGDRIYQASARSLLREGVEATARAIAEWFRGRSVDRLYITVDIDVTDCTEAPATGIPAIGGLSSAQVIAMIERLSDEFVILGGDVVEVAPTLTVATSWAEEPTCQVAARYLRALCGST